VSFRTSIIAGGYALLLCISMSTCTHAAESWTSIKSKNFFVVGNATEPAMRDVVVRLEQFRDAVSQLFPALKLDAGVPVRVVIFKDDLSYRPFKPRRTDGTPDDAVAGYFLGGDDVDYVAVSIDASRGDPYRTIFHEYAHYLLHSNTDRTDLPGGLTKGWLNILKPCRLSTANKSCLERRSKIACGGCGETPLFLLRRFLRPIQMHCKNRMTPRASCFTHRRGSLCII